MSENDQVNNPSHYSKNNIFPGECIDYACQLNGVDFNSFKYVWRHLDKEKPLQDLDKALWYVQYSIDNDNKNKYKKSSPSVKTIDFLEKEVYNDTCHNNKNYYDIILRRTLLNIFKGEHVEAKENISELKRLYTHNM